VRSAGAEPIAITNAAVVTKPGTRIENATVVIDKGRIVAVGAGVAVPAGARVIEGKGKVVTAGFIDSVSGLGLVGIDAESSSVDGRFDPSDALHGDSVHASFEARDAFQPNEASIAVARAGGITMVAASPAGGLVGGQVAVYALDGSAEPIRAPVAMQAAIGVDGAAAVGGSRGKALETLRELLDDARAYGRDKAGYERNAKRRLIADRLDLDALQPVLRGTLPLVLEAQSEGDIRAALRLAAQFKIRLAIVGASEAWRLAADLAKAKVTVIIDPIANLPVYLSASDIRDDAAAVLDKAGVPVAISTIGGAWNARTLRQLAGNAVARGLPWDRALAAVTTMPAALLGLAGRGTLEKNAVADVVVWSGDPFENATAAEVVIIGGIVQSLANHQTKLLERYRKLPVAR
jgi:imidazolonepropionase-like amidohydrolase